ALKKTAPKKSRPAAAPQPVPEPTVIETSAVAHMQSPADIMVTEIGHAEPAGHRHIAPRAAAIAQFLTPKNLRTQFILTEVLQPPLALRQDQK
ncbi:MAG: hypothetical protein ACM359_05450, partial [Bacillota bacterium]